MATLYFGGSFNPIHHGHLICARAAAEAGGYDRIMLIPSGQPPHKPGDVELAPAANRLEMCRLAVASDGLFAVDPIEVEQAGPSYTLATVRSLKARGADGVDWLIGGDMLAWLPQWHEPLTLVREARLMIMARPGWAFDWSALPEGLRHLSANVLPAPLIDISATRIRQRTRDQQPITYLTPPTVADYIQAHGLYR